MSITVATLVKNEADRFLEKALKAWTEFADEIVVVDDGSTDESRTICLDYGCKVYDAETPMQGNEYLVRSQLWDLVADSDGWVLHIDADQVPSCDPMPFLVEPITAVRVYDLWSPTTYREDAWWRGHKRPWWWWVHAPSFEGPWEWYDRGWHSGHVPVNLRGDVHGADEVSLLHYAYATPELREQKAAMYDGLSAHLTDKERFHAKTILTKNPRVHPLPFQPEWPLL